MGKKSRMKKIVREFMSKEKDPTEVFAIQTFHNFCRFIITLPETYGCDPEFPETRDDFTMAFDMFIEDEMPSLKMQDDTEEGQMHRAAVKYIEEEISFVGSEDAEMTIGNGDEEFTTHMSFLELVKLRRGLPTEFFIA